MTNPAIYGDNQIYLGGYIFPIRGGIQLNKASTFASKITIGKSTRADQVIADEWIQENWQQGMLIYQLDEEADEGRFHWSTNDTRYSEKMFLPPLVTSLGNPGSTAPDYLVDFNGGLHASFGGAIYKWDNTGSSWNTALHDVGSAVKDHLIYNSKLFLVHSGGYHIFDPAGPTWTSYAVAVEHFVKYDFAPAEKIVYVSSGGVLKSSSDGVTWSTDVGTLYDHTPTELVSFRNANDDPTLFLATEEGLFSVDFTSRSIFDTSLKLLKTPSAGKKSTVWSDGNLYVPSSLALWRYPRSGQITNVGLDKDDGLPTFIRGRITNLVNTPSYLIASVDATSLGTTAEENMFFGMEFETIVIPPATLSGYSGIFAWTGSGWHNIFLSSSSAQGLKAMTMCTSYNNNERWLCFTDGLNVKYIVLPEGNYDPMYDPNAKFAETGEFISSWFDGGVAEQDKLASSIRLRAKNITSTETIDVYYGIDDDENWIHLGQVNDTTINSKGKVTFKFNTPSGIIFSTIRIKLVFNRGTDNTKSPVLLFFNLHYKKSPDILWGFNFSVHNCDTPNFQGLWESLKSICDNKETVLFAYRANGQDEEHIVLITSVSGIRHSGSEGYDFFTVGIVELEN